MLRRDDGGRDAGQGESGYRGREMTAGEIDATGEETGEKDGCEGGYEYGEMDAESVLTLKGSSGGGGSSLVFCARS
jgi:hypothetical protein